MAHLRFRPRVEALEVRLVPSFAAPQFYAAGPSPRSIAVGDFKNDGHLDIVTANDGTGNSVSVLLNNGDGTFAAPVNYPVGSQPTQVVVADFTGNGILDLAVTNLNSNSVSILLGNGDGTFRAGVTVPVSTNPRALAVADFNRDGKPDLVVACTDGYETEGADVLLGNGDGTFTLSQHISFPGGVNGPLSVTVGDFNGDGIPDFATADLGYNVSRFQGRGDGTFLPRVTYAAGHRTLQITSADLEREGKLDLVVTGDTYGTVTVLPGNGNGTFQSPIGYDYDSARWSAVADFNGDGNPDLVTLLSDGDTLRVRLGNGNYTFQTPQVYQVGPGPGAGATSVTVADLVGDGYPDILVADRNFDYVAVLRNLDHPSANHFRVSAPAASVAGSPSDVTVTALNPVGNVDPNYHGQVHFASTDNNASLPADYTFTTDDHGRHTFPVTFLTAARQTVTVSASGGLNGHADVTVTPAETSTLVVAGFPSPVTAGTVHTFIVTAQDAFGNTTPAYTGTVHFTSSDTGATVPEDYTFTNADRGTQTFGAVLVTASSQSITGADTGTPSITGTQDGIVVQPAAADHLVVSAPDSVYAGMPFPFTVTAADRFDNVVDGYRGTVSLMTSDPLALFPPDYTYTAADAGSHTFTVALGTPGDQTITATDTSSGIGGNALVHVLSAPPDPSPRSNNPPFRPGSAEYIDAGGAFDLVRAYSIAGDNVNALLIDNGVGTVSRSMTSLGHWVLFDEGLGDWGLGTDWRPFGF
jgi:hypothetical protein